MILSYHLFETYVTQFHQVDALFNAIDQDFVLLVNVDYVSSMNEVFMCYSMVNLSESSIFDISKKGPGYLSRIARHTTL